MGKKMIHDVCVYLNRYSGIEKSKIINKNPSQLKMIIRILQKSC